MQPGAEFLMDNLVLSKGVPTPVAPASVKLGCSECAYLEVIALFYIDCPQTHHICSEDELFTDALESATQLGLKSHLN